MNNRRVIVETIEKFFKEKTSALSFIELKKDLNIGDMEIKADIPLPIIVDELITEIKENRAQEELKISSIIDGIIYLIGVDPEFKYNHEYKEMLYKYNKDIEEIIYLKGMKSIQDSNIDDGLIYFRSLINLNKNSCKALYGYGVSLEEKSIIYFNNKDIKKGEKFFIKSTNTFEEILDIDEEYSLAYYKLGYHYLNMKQFKKAQIMWEKFIEIDEDEDRLEEINQKIIEIQDDVDYEEGCNEIFIGNPQRGIDKLLPLKEKYTDWWNLLFMIGFAYRQLGMYDKSKELYEQVLALNPNQLDTLNELGLCLAYMGDFNEAIAKFSSALKMKPNEGEILCNRAMTYLQLGDFKNAERDIEHALNINPNDEITLQCKREIERQKTE